MESFNIHKSYIKLTTSTDHHDTKLPIQDHPNNPHRKPIIVIIAAASFLLLTLFLVLLLAAAIFQSITDSDDDNEDSNPSSPIQSICSFTPHPTTCITSITSINPHPLSDPHLLLSFSLRAAVVELKNLSSSVPKDLIPRVNDEKRIVGALKDCVELIDDAVQRTNQSSSVASSSMVSSSENDLRTWISAAMTDVETCVDGLEETQSSSSAAAAAASSLVVMDEVKGGVERVNVCLSNSLAIVANMGIILKKFDHHAR